MAAKLINPNTKKVKNAFFKAEKMQRTSLRAETKCRGLGFLSTTLKACV